MALPDDLRAYILATDRALERCAQAVESFQQDRQTLRVRAHELQGLAREYERTFYGYSHAALLRAEIGGLEGSIRRLDEQIGEQTKIIKETLNARSSTIALHLFRTDPEYAALLEESQTLKENFCMAQEICNDFLKIVDDAAARVVNAQHVGMIHGIALGTIVDPAEVKRGIGITNTAIGYFNRDFDFGLVLDGSVCLARICVPYGGPRVEYLQEAKRQILARRGVVGRFHDTLAQKIPRVFDAAEAYVADAIGMARSARPPYR